MCVNVILVVSCSVLPRSVVCFCYFLGFLGMFSVYHCVYQLLWDLKYIKNNNVCVCLHTCELFLANPKTGQWDH